MQISSLLTAAVLAVMTHGAPLDRHYDVHERQSSASSWAKRDRLSSNTLLPMRIGVTQNNLDQGYELLMDVAHPSSNNYGRHYTAEQVVDVFAPKADTVEAVQAWLESVGIDASRISLSANKQWLQLDATASEVEDLFQTEYHVYEHVVTGKSSVGCDEYSVPVHLQPHIDYITPGVKPLALKSTNSDDARLAKRSFGWGKGRRPSGPIKAPLPSALWEKILGAIKNGILLSLCDEVITPPCISTMYNITKATKAAAGNELGIFEDLGDYYSQTDLNLFFGSFATQIEQNTHPTLHGVDGAIAPTNVTDAGPESDLDFQISYPIIYPQNSILYQTDDPVYEANYMYDGLFNNFLDAIDGSYCTYSAFGETGNSVIDPPYPHDVEGGYNKPLQCGVYKPTNVISISYGGQEADLPASYQQRQCNEFMKLGMQGVSVVFASGDSGVGGRSGDDNTDGCLGSSGNIFSPDFPATCPYLTTVGATYLPQNGNVRKDEEVAVTRFASGGGFSNIYPQPSYQEKAVATYFEISDPPYTYYSSVNNNSFGADEGVYNRIGRGYPDVSAIGDNILIFNQGAPTLIGGTSASAPTFASILNRINEELLAKGKPRVGFVNPVLYMNPSVLHDITAGNNPGCGTTGFPAAPGWDPVTGLGTPNYPAMLNLFMSLPSNSGSST